MYTKISEFINFKLNEKTENQVYDSGCIMGYFDTPLKKIEIDENDLYNDDENRYGVELEPHCTIGYGFIDDKIDEDEIISLLYMINCPTINSSKISLFKNEKYDVVKFDINSEELRLINKIFTSTFPYKTDYPDYHAHSTIAYCKVGKGKKYVEKFKEPLEKKIAYWIYSKSNGKKIKIVPNKEIKIIRKANE